MHIKYNNLCYFAIKLKQKLNPTDYIIPLAWPNLMVISAGSWYDFITRALGITKNGKYRAGHSAFLLVNSKTGEIFYFDFGRYHTKQGYGRVRDEKTDHDLRVKTIANCNANGILNIESILLEVANNKSSHGVDKMYASILSGIDFNRAFEFAKKTQNRGMLPYGPFVRSGTNCSRFVASVMRAAKPSIIKRLRLKYPASFSPSPKRNVGIANSTYYIVDDRNCEKINRNSIKAYLKSIEK